MTLKRLALDDYGVRFVDEVPPEPVQTVIEPIKLGVENLVLGGKPEKAKVDLALKVNKTGELGAKGTFTPQPLDAELKVALKQLEIAPFQPYFADKVNITLSSGEIAAEGIARFAMPPDGKPVFEYEGTAAINKLATVDKVNAEDFLKWESLFFDGIKLKSEPLFVDVKEVALTDFYSRLVVNADGTLNVQGVMAKEGAKTEEGAAPAEAPAGKSVPEPKKEPKRRRRRRSRPNPRPLRRPRTVPAPSPS